MASAVSTKTALIADDTIDVGIEPVQSTSLGDRRRPGSGGGERRRHGRRHRFGSWTRPRRARRAATRDPLRARILLEYAQWLDFFKIELGVLGRDNKVYYAYNLSRDKPSVRVGDPAQEQRLYMNPADSQFAALDRRLADKAGIADKGGIILQFYPAAAQAILYELEQKHAGAIAAGDSPNRLSRHPRRRSFCV